MTDVNVTVSVEIGGHKLVLLDDTPMTPYPHEQEMIDKAVDKLCQEYLTAIERENQVVQFALGVLDAQRENPDTLNEWLEEEFFIFPQMVKLLRLGTDKDEEDVIRIMHRDATLAGWLE